ncbi:MAG: CvpA family protein [Lachnospiraceae bacterium]|nr:CvpA family protein [Lachnospiraceae bacterium]
MEEIQELIEELPAVRLSEYSFSGISASTLTTVLAAVFLIVMMAIGYKRGIIVELSGMIALIGSFVGLLLVKPYVLPFFPQSFGRLARAVCYLLFCFLVFMLVRALVRHIGHMFRKIPVIGWLVAVLGAAAGCVKAVICVLILQHATGIAVTEAVLETIDKLPLAL